MKNVGVMKNIGAMKNIDIKKNMGVWISIHERNIRKIILFTLHKINKKRSIQEIVVHNTAIAPKHFKNWVRKSKCPIN